MKRAFLLIDIQNDYFPGGRMELAGAEEAGKNAAILLKAAREREVPVIHVQHLSTRPGATFFIPGTPGAEIHHTVAPDNETVVQKNYPNSFNSTNLQEILDKNGIDALIICGMMTHMCVDSTVRSAGDLGYRCTVAADACATRDLVWQGETIPAALVHGSFLSAMNGLFADVLNTEEIIRTGI